MQANGRAGDVSEDGAAQKAKKSMKGSAGSCQECIRTKTKCSRVWPCDNCVRRGVADCCPERIARKSKFDTLRERIADLEKENEDLRSHSAGFQANLRSPVSATPQQSLSNVGHHMTAPQSPQNSPHRVPLPLNAFETNATVASPSNRATDLATISQDLLEVANGKSASFVGHGASNLYKLENTATYTSPPECLLGAFPFGDASASIGPSTTLLPTAQHARELVDVYFTSIDWMYRPISRERVDQDINSIYTVGPQAVLPHELSRLLMVFALGTVFNFPIESTSPDCLGASFSLIQQTARSYFREASKLLSYPGQHFLYHHSVTTCEVLHLMVSFLFVLGDGQAAKTAWPLLGLTTRISQAVGLHKDPRMWAFLDRGEAIRRATVFWEVLTYDMLQCLNWGRPPSISYGHVSCPSPAELEAWYRDGTSTMGQPSINANLQTCNPVTFHTLKYDFAKLFNELDRRLRSVELATPKELKVQLDPFAANVNNSPQGHMLALLLHKALLALHQPLFMKSLTAGGEPMISPFAASFNACIVSSRKHTEILKSIIRTNPRAAYFWWFFLFHALNSAIIQGLVLLKVPDSMLAQEVFTDFQTSYDTLACMSPRSELVRRALPVLQRLNEDIRVKLKTPASMMAPAPASTTQFPNNGGEPEQSAWIFNSQPLNSNTWQNSIVRQPYEASYQSSINSILSDDEFASWLQNPTAMLTGPLDAEHADPANWSAKDPVLQTLLFWNPERNA